MADDWGGGGGGGREIRQAAIGIIHFLSYKTTVVSHHKEQVLPTSRADHLPTHTGNAEDDWKLCAEGLHDLAPFGLRCNLLLLKRCMSTRIPRMHMLSCHGSRPGLTCHSGLKHKQHRYMSLLL